MLTLKYIYLLHMYLKIIIIYWIMDDAFNIINIRMQSLLANLLA